jgi:ATP-dependent Lon protease
LIFQSIFSIHFFNSLLEVSYVISIILSNFKYSCFFFTSINKLSSPYIINASKISSSLFEHTYIPSNNLKNISPDPIIRPSINNKIEYIKIKTIEENDDATRIADLISSVLKVKKDEAYKLFSQTNIEQRLFDIIEVIKKEIESFKIQKEITQKVNSKIEKTHKDYFLKEQIKAKKKN